MRFCSAVLYIKETGEEGAPGRKGVVGQSGLDTECQVTSPDTGTENEAAARSLRAL